MIEVGTKSRSSQEVTEQLTARNMGSGALPVYATPALAALMENAAMNALRGFLPEGMGSVGTRIDISHNAPTPIGMTVTAEAEIVSVSEDGRRAEFAVRAWDERGSIGAGTHTRAVIQEERFLSRCNAKRTPK